MASHAFSEIRNLHAIHRDSQVISQITRSCSLVEDIVFFALQAQLLKVIVVKNTVKDLIQIKHCCSIMKNEEQLKENRIQHNLWKCQFCVGILLVPQKSIKSLFSAEKIFCK